MRFRYDSAQHAAAETRLQQLLAHALAGENEQDFPKVADTPINRKRFCNYCVYRSRCNRGIHAGNLPTWTTPKSLRHRPDAALEFTLDDVDELAF
ncbi:MAG: hypothetical protein R2911_29850 [Caldilineaceae bacterium]